MFYALKEKSALLKIIFVFFALLLLRCEKEKEEEIIDPGQTNIDYSLCLRLGRASCAYDEASDIYYYPVQSDTVLNYNTLVSYGTAVKEIYLNGKKLLNKSYNNLGTIYTNKSYELKACFVNDSTEIHELVFIVFPTVQIFTNTEIVDEPKTVGKLILNNPNYQDDNIFSRETELLIGIEIRGNIYLGRPKSSYGFEIWTDEFGTDNEDISLLGLREDDDWILDAMYGDLMRMRNRVAFQIWNSMAKLYYSYEEPQALCGIHGKFVEVFINNEYQGIYSLNEELDRKQLKLKRFTNITRGLLYKGEEWGENVTSFYNYTDTCSGINWDGWEIQYPKPEQQILWDPLYNLTKFVVESDDNSFKDSIHNYIDIDNAADYYIFINYIGATDNMGKNIFLARYDTNTVFFLAPWDMDWSFGRYWDTIAIGYTGVSTNNLFERLLEVDPDNYKSKLKERWEFLIENDLEQDKVISQFKAYHNRFVNNGVIERENNKWTNAGINTEEELLYIEDWLKNRINYLNGYFKDL